ncbi:MAG: DM13 domain-containing protein [Candidatus Nitrosotenuis sp.]
MNRNIIIGVIIAVVAIPMAVYAASPLFINTTIDEPLPANLKIPESTMSDKMMDNKMMDNKMMDNKMMDNKMMDNKMMDNKMMDNKMMDNKMAGEIMPKPMLALSGMFVGVGDGIHDAQGMAKILPLDNGASILRLEDFRSTNGPDLYVYLATDKDATDFVSLGRLKANTGNQNYDIPQGTNLAKYDTVLIWCKQFSVLFGSASLS